MMNNRKFEKSKRLIKSQTSSTFLEEPQLIKYISYKSQLCFNLYENRLIHAEFLKEIFAELLENKEILRYNFQTKIFSLYTDKNNFYILKNSFLRQTKIIFIGTLIILLVRSFPYKVIIYENQNLIRLYRTTTFKFLNSPLSTSTLVIYKIIRRLKTRFYILNKQAAEIFSGLFRALILNYLQYTNLNQTISLNSQSYSNLFDNVESLQVLNFYNRLKMFLICILFKESLLVNRFSNCYDSKREILNQTNLN